MAASMLHDRGPAWRIALTFIAIALLITIGLVALFTSRTANAGNKRSRPGVATIVFVEADLPPGAGESDENERNSGCAAAKAESIWTEAEKLLASYWTRAVRAPAGERWSLSMYALNGDGAGRELVRIGPNELADVVKARGVARIERQQDGWSKYAEAAKAKYKKSFEPDPRQDIVGTVRFLLTNRNRFISDDIGIIKVVYVSDMLHYNCDAASIDPEAGYWNFLSLDAVETFQRQIGEGALYRADGELTSVSVPIEPLVDKSDDRLFEVYSVAIPRLTCESIPAQEVRRILATGEIQKTWEHLFGKMNAKTVLLNVDTDRVFAP
jgi:hypothetical protein